MLTRQYFYYQLVKGGLDYFETRTEFWRQQKPLYARKVDKQRLNSIRKKEDKRPTTTQSEKVLKKLKEIDDALTKGDVEKTLRVGLKLLKTVGKKRIIEPRYNYTKIRTAQG